MVRDALDKGQHRTLLVMDNVTNVDMCSGFISHSPKEMVLLIITRNSMLFREEEKNHSDHRSGLPKLHLEDFEE